MISQFSIVVHVSWTNAILVYENGTSCKSSMKYLIISLDKGNAYCETNCIRRQEGLIKFNV